MRVVLIEDHDLTRVGLRMVFQQHPAVEIVGEAADGVAGLKLLKTMQPDVAIVDLGLPGLDGIEVTQRLKQHLSEAVDATAPQTRVMILTLQGGKEAVLAAFAAGADSYCMKDLPSTRLLEALHDTYEGNNWIDPAIAKLVLQHHRQMQAATATSASDSKTVDILATDEQVLGFHAYPLTSREEEILTLVVNGYSNVEIANECYITVGTVKTHVRNILNKLGVDDRTQAAVRALRSGLIV